MVAALIEGSWACGRLQTVRRSAVGLFMTVVATLAVASCTTAAGDPAAPGVVDIQGTWESADFTYTLTQSQDQVRGVAVCTIEAACGGVVDGSPVHGSVNGVALQNVFRGATQSSDVCRHDRRRHHHRRHPHDRLRCRHRHASATVGIKRVAPRCALRLGRFVDRSPTTSRWVARGDLGGARCLSAAPEGKAPMISAAYGQA